MQRFESASTWGGLKSGLAWCCFLTIPFSNLPLAAQQAEPNDSTNPTKKKTLVAKPQPDFEEIVVTARRVAQNRFEVDRSLHLLSGDELIELQGQSLPDALQETTGVFMQRTNRGAGAPILRGLVGPQNLILVDGIRFNTATFRTGPNQYLAMLDPTAIDHLEVMLGPGSVLYGSDAMGGVIQVFPFTWKKEQGWGARGGARFVSHDVSYTLFADSEWQNQQGGVLVGGSFCSLDQLRAGGGVQQPLSDYTQGSWRVRGKTLIADHTQLGLTYLGMRIRNAGREDRLYEGRFRYYDDDDDFVYLDLQYRPGGVLKELRLAASFHRMNEVVDRYRCSLPADPGLGDAAGCLVLGRVGHAAVPLDPLSRQEINTDTIVTPGLLAHANLGFLDNRIRLTTGLEAYYDVVSSGMEERRADRDPAWIWQTLERGNFSDDSRYRSIGAFVHAEADLWVIDERALVAGLGGRISNFSAQADNVPGLGDVDYTYTGAVATAGLKYLYGDSFMTYVNYSGGFRAPNLQETTVLGDTGSKFEVPNAALDPEKSHTIELGTRADGRLFQFSLSAFTSFLEDVIDERDLTQDEKDALGLDPVAIGDKQAAQRVNSSSALYWGLEGTLVLGPWYDLKLWSKAAWVRAEIKTCDWTVNPSACEKKITYPARRIPPVMGAVGLRYQPVDQDFYLEFFTRFAGRQARLHPSDEQDLRICEDPDNLGDTFADSGLKCSGTPGWLTLNLRGGYRFDEFLRVDVAATNLTDKFYRYHGSGVDAPGFGFSVSLLGSY